MMSHCRTAALISCTYDILFICLCDWICKNHPCSHKKSKTEIDFTAQDHNYTQ